MTTKTLGQVLYEAFVSGHRGMNHWPGLAPDAQADFEREAQAVAAVVREQCAQAAWAHYMDHCKRMGMTPAEFGGWCSASAIRSMKL